MKIITTTLLLFFLSISFSFGQKTEIETKIKNTDLKQIKNNVLVDYDFIKQTRDKITIIEFWETWCAPCIKGMGHLKALQAKFQNSLKVVCVSSDDFDKTTSFIAKNDFPFDFIYDPEEQLSKIFPHQGIPHTILIDKEGHINAETYPGYIDQEVLTKLDNNNQVHLPTKRNFTPSELRDKENSNSLLKFDLQRYELGDRKYIETNKQEIPIQIVKGYSGKTYKDTLETIEECIIAGKNALEIYQYAYDDIPISRFIYNENLKYLNSDLPHFLYRMKFSSSNLIGKFKEKLIHQLNSAWGLKTEIIEKECDYYELVSIDLKEGKIMDKPNSEIKITGQTIQSYKELTTNNILTLENISKLIENQIVHLQSNKYYDQEDKRIYFPVTTSLTGVYIINLSIKNESSNVDSWIEILSDNGLNLVKKRGKIKFVRIEKAVHNIGYNK
jgi:thiol-disulfide isomerase/thioredoxin